MRLKQQACLQMHLQSQQSDTGLLAGVHEQGQLVKHVAHLLPTHSSSCLLHCHKTLHRASSCTDSSLKIAFKCPLRLQQLLLHGKALAQSVHFVTNTGTNQSPT